MAMTLRLDDGLDERLRAQAATEHDSMQKVAARAIEEYIERHDRRAVLDGVLDKVLVKYAGAIERLGQ